MATILEHLRTRERFVLIGAGYGAWKSATPHPLLGNLLPDTNAGNAAVLCVCNAREELVWFPSRELKVLSVDGTRPRELLTR